MKIALNYIKTFVCLLIIFIGIGIISCIIPNSQIQKNIKKSKDNIFEDGCYPTAIIHKKACQLDNFTDALILNQMYCVDNAQPYYSFISVPSVMKGSPTQSLKLLTQKEIEPNNLYARYWHGTTFFFRPLFIFFQYSEIQYILYILSTVLWFFLLLYCYDIGVRKVYLLVFSLCFSLVYGFVTKFSLQFFPVWAISIISSILVCNKVKKQKSILPLFFSIGCITCYFDLLTTPILTWGIPLLIFILISNFETIKTAIKEIAFISINWFLGFFLSWIVKWLLATILIGEKVFTNVINTVQYRSSADDFNRIDAIFDNFEMLYSTFILIYFSVLVLMAIIGFTKKGLTKSMIFLLISISPFAWYFIVANHSYIHFWFTYRSLFVFLLGSSFALCEVISITKIKERFQNFFRRLH